MLSFDAESHRYIWDGKPVPGVTSIIRAALGDPFARISPAVLERKRQLGQAAHRAWQLDDEGRLDEATVHPEVMPRLEAWRTFRRQFFPGEILFAERALYHEWLGYAGMPDLVLLLGDGCRAVIDGKTGLPGPMAGLQTAAYADLVRAEFGEDGPIRRFALRALPTGKYKLDEYTGPMDFRDFLGCLAVYRLNERIANE